MCEVCVCVCVRVFICMSPTWQRTGDIPPLRRNRTSYLSRRLATNRRLKCGQLVDTIKLTFLWTFYTVAQIYLFALFM